MFTNPFSLKSTGSTIKATEINAAGQAIAMALDGTQGGLYTPLSPLMIGGSQGLRFPSGGTLIAASGSTVTLSGTTTASDLTMTGSANVKLASRSIQRVMPYFALSRVAGGADHWDAAHLGRYLNITLNGQLYIPLRVPHGATLTAVAVYIQGATGHAGLPADMPLLNIQTVGIDDSEASLGNELDNSASVAEFEDVHDITVSGLSHVVDRVNQRLVALLTAENGANALTGARYIGARVTYTITAYDED